MSFPQAHILYLHGFLSSPMSAKAQDMRHYVAQHFPHIQLHMPVLSGVPAKAVEQTITRFTALQHTYGEQLLGVVGSSMGGFLATHLVEKVSSSEYSETEVNERVLVFASPNSEDKDCLILAVSDSL